MPESGGYLLGRHKENQALSPEEQDVRLISGCDEFVRYFPIFKSKPVVDLQKWIVL
jgi:hypothetical protein